MRRSDTLPAPAAAPASPEPEPDEAWEEPTQPAYRTIAAEGTEKRERIKRSARETQPLPLPRPPANSDRKR